MDRFFSFLLWPKRGVHRPWKQGKKKWGSITYCKDWANKANKMFIVWLCWLFRFWKGDRELEVHTATYRPGIDQSQHAKSVSHIISYNIIPSREIPILQFQPENSRFGHIVSILPFSFILFSHILLLSRSKERKRLHSSVSFFCCALSFFVFVLIIVDSLIIFSAVLANLSIVGCTVRQLVLYFRICN